jgi:hypothetical protein
MAALLRDKEEGGEKGRWSTLEGVLTGSSPAAPAGPRAGPKPVGSTRARDMVVNCVMPFLHAWAKRGDDRVLEELCLDGYRRFPRLQENEITREMARLASEGRRDGDDRRRVVDGARRQQGLVHLHRVMSGLGNGAV